MITKQELDLFIIKAAFDKPDDALIEQFIEMSMQMLVRELQYTTLEERKGVTAYLFYPHRILASVDQTANTYRWLLEGLQKHFKKFNIESHLMYGTDEYYLMVTGGALIDSVENYEAKKNLI